MRAQVTKDVEVMAWWECVKNQGHPDIETGWPEIKDIASLRDVIASIMWVSSCHHAGQHVNVSQPFLLSLTSEEKLDRQKPECTHQKDTSRPLCFP